MRAEEHVALEVEAHALQRRRVAVAAAGIGLVRELGLELLDLRAQIGDLRLGVLCGGLGLRCAGLRLGGRLFEAGRE